MKSCFSFRAGVARLTLLLGLTLLSACGFHLRQPQPLPFKSLYISGVADASEMRAILVRNIRAQGSTEIAEKALGADATLVIVNEGREKTILSLNAAGRVREFRLKQRILFKITDSKGQILLPQDEVAISRDFTFSDNALLAKEQEEALLYRDMQNDLIQQLMRRIAAAKARPAEE